MLKMSPREGEESSHLTVMAISLSPHWYSSCQMFTEWFITYSWALCMQAYEACLNQMLAYWFIFYSRKITEHHIGSRYFLSWLVYQRFSNATGDVPKVFVSSFE